MIHIVYHLIEFRILSDPVLIILASLNIKECRRMKIENYTEAQHKNSELLD